MPKKSSSPAVRSRLISKTLTQRLEALEEEPQPPVEEKPQTPPPQQRPSVAPRATIPRSVVIVEKPREAMINQGMQVIISEEETDNGPLLLRVGVDRMSGSLFHCILRAIYPPYVEWERERRIRKVKEFRQDLAGSFDGYYMRLDQASAPRPSLANCKKDIESFDGALPYDYMEYIAKVVNKVIVLLTVSSDGVLRFIPGTKIYGKPGNLITSGRSSNDTKTSSPITYARAEPVFMFILHLGGPAYELLTWRRKDRNYTLFPESHPITERLVELANRQ
jgi:hypothetical protein